LIIVIGATNPRLSGYGGTEEVLIGLGVLAMSFVLFLVRRVLQDRKRVVLREAIPVEPGVAAVGGLAS
jgi:hypothetical protein